jgi:hypothetical protein
MGPEAGLAHVVDGLIGTNRNQRCNQALRQADVQSNYAQVRTPSTERVTRIELALSAWEADVLPLNYTRRVELGHVSALPGWVRGRR